jgi:S-formylglutathione hydrolase
MSIERIKNDKVFAGNVEVYRHSSEVNHCDMQFSVFRPKQEQHSSVPLLTWLSGLTCTEDTFMFKAGALKMASDLGIMILAPDTSPRGDNVPDDENGAYDFGLGAGFYVNATKSPWQTHYNMYDYVTKELPSIITSNFNVDKNRFGIFGHSMGGHGALTIGLRNPDTYRSISAFAPICNPINCPWGTKALSNYLGENSSAWSEYDATEIVLAGNYKLPQNLIRIDQGLADEFLERELNTDKFEQACKDSELAIDIHRHVGHGHGYYFISTFIDDHLQHHAKYLCN